MTFSMRVDVGVDLGARALLGHGDEQALSPLCLHTEARQEALLRHALDDDVDGQRQAEGELPQHRGCDEGLYPRERQE